jgi:hypothetical protein
VPCRNHGYTLDGSGPTASRCWPWTAAWSTPGTAIERFDELVDLGSEATRIPVGGGFAGIIGDGSVNDEGWIEVFQSGRDRLAVLHVSGQPYDHALKDALAYPTDADTHGGTLTLPGGELALFSSALDEVRDNSVPLVWASPGPTPKAYRPASMSTPRAEVVTGLLVALPAGPTDCRCGGGPAWPRMRSSPAGCCRRSRYGGIAVLPVTARPPRRDAQSTIERSPE